MAAAGHAYARYKNLLLQCVIRLHRMHEMLTILTDVRGVCQSVCLSVTRIKLAARAVCAWSCGAAFAKCLWPLVNVTFTLETTFTQ